ncbi:MAG: hypothetical protein AAB307_04065, partial [Deltaproteobacteria bacterium]
MGSISRAAKSALLWVYWHPFRVVVQKMPARYVYFMADILGSAMYLLLRGRRRALKKELSIIAGRGTAGKKSENAVRGAFVVNARKDLEVL